MIHGAFRMGVEATDCNLKKLVKAMWKIFDYSPARRDAFIEIRGVSKFPLKYVFHFSA